MSSVVEFSYPKFILFLLGFWYSVSTYLLHLFHYFRRFRKNGSSSKGVQSDSGVVLLEAMEEKQDFLKVENDGENEEQNDEKKDEKEYEKDSSEFSFTFKFPTYEEFNKNQKDFDSISQLVPLPSCVHNKKLSKDIDSFEVLLEGSEAAGMDSNEEISDFEDVASVDEQVMVGSLNEMDDKEEVDAFSEVKLEKVNDESEKEMDTFDMDSIGSKIEEKEEEMDTFSEDELQKVVDGSVCTSSDSNMDLIGSNDTSPSSDVSQEDGFLSDEDFELEFVKRDEKKWMTSDGFLSENDFDAKIKNESANHQNGNNLSSDTTTNKLECLWEHQELIEQLKMEMKKVKAIGLPTIFEESESPPKIMEELKPWKIEEVYGQHGGGGKLSEAHKFYKSYRERMRKFDIFNYQKMYTIGFLQLKDPLQSTSKGSIPEILSQSFKSYKGKKHEEDPTIKFIKELQNDLEVVYVGQMCLSWEILHWQYEKAMDIWESDTHLFRRFNELASEFQQFQVLMQRFVEDEPFQGPRVHHYVKTRCIFRNLLQVPVIRDDPVKNLKSKSEVVYDITSDTLVEIFQESIRLFWQFVRADKYKRQTYPEFQKPEDAQLYMDLQKDLHKKEKKLKEVLRSGNCILKKLRSCREEETEDGALYFFCQVDMKLVSRVLQMSTLTSDQLIWCHNKLNRVSFFNRKIHVEPSFLLFPC